jgi:hypothetical protein
VVIEGITALSGQKQYKEGSSGEIRTKETKVIGKEVNEDY